MKYYKLDKSELSFEHPENWKISNEENIISVFDPIDGYGALQFSVYNKNDNTPINLLDELGEYLSKRHEDCEILMKDKFAYCNCLDEEDILWRYWLFQKKGNIIFASYNCTLNDGGKDDEIIDAIIKSACSLMSIS